MRELRAWLNELIGAHLGKRHARWSPLAHSKRGAPKGALYPPGRLMAVKGPQLALRRRFTSQ
jgi:hypothetical protein